MDLNGVRAFVAVVEHRSVRNAARALGYSQSAVSRHVASFERSVGGAVFVREHHGMRLTGLGADVYPHARQVLRGVDSMIGARGPSERVG